MLEGRKPWTVSDPPSPATNWTEEERERCVAAANETIENGGTDEEAIFACIGAAGKSEKKEKIMVQETILVQVSKVLSHDQIREAIWAYVERYPSPVEAEMPALSMASLAVDDVYDDYAMVSGGGRVFKLPFSIVDDKVVFGEPIEGTMEFMPKGVKAAEPSWKCGAARNLSVNQERSWDGAAAKGRIFSWAGWPDNPSSSQARRGFLAYDSANPDLKGSYKLPFADVIDGSLVALRSGLNAAANRLPQTDIPEGVQGTARGVIDGYQAKFEKMLAEGKLVGVAGTKTVFKIYERGGETRWLAMTSAAFKDREEEIVSRDALDYSIGVSDIMGYRGYLNLYHLQNIKLGTCEFQYRVDKVLLEGGKWYDNSYANMVRKWLDTNKEDGEPAGCSIEFFYDKDDLADGVYSKIIIFNRAVLKRKHAANQYTWIGGDPDNMRRKEMSTLKDLQDILGEELAAEALAGAEAHSKDVEGTGAEFKGDGVEGTADPNAGDKPAEGAVTETAEPADKGTETGTEGEAPAEGAEAAGEETAPGDDEKDETVIKEIVFSKESISLLADIIAEKLGTKGLEDKVEALAAAVTVLAKSDEERIAAKLAKVPKGTIRDSKSGDVAPLKDKEIVESGTEEKSEGDELTEARDKAYEGFVH